MTPDAAPDDLKDLIHLRDLLAAIADLNGLIALLITQSAGRRGLSQSDLAHALGCSASAATRLIDQLEQAALVERRPHPNDRRINLVILTEAGKAEALGLPAELRTVLDAARALDLSPMLGALRSVAPPPADAQSA